MNPYPSSFTSESTLLEHEVNEQLIFKALRLDVLNREARSRLQVLKQNRSPLATEFEKTLLISEGLAQEMEALTSGRTIGRGRPMRDAIQTACETGRVEDWSRALQMLADRSLDSHCPAFFAGAILDSLKPFRIPDAAYIKLIEPLQMEMELDAPGYDWNWGTEPDHLKSKAAWQSAIKAYGRHQRIASLLSSI